MSVDSLPHRKWNETKQQPSMLLGPAVTGCYLVSFHFLWAILWPHTVLHYFVTSNTNLNSGLPSGIGFDNFYTMSTSDYTNGHYAFDGYTTTKIYWNIDSNSWHMELLSNPNFLARASIPGNEYPFGTRTWDVFTDDEQQGNFSVDLNLNGCDLDSQYNCFDGSCISEGQR